MKGTEMTVRALEHAGNLVQGLGRVAIDMAVKTADEQKVLRRQVGELQTRNEQLVGQTANLQGAATIEKSKIMPALKTLARIKVIADEALSGTDIAGLRRVLAEIEDNLDPFANCNGDFGRYVVEYTAERANLKTARERRQGNV